MPGGEFWEVRISEGFQKKLELNRCGLMKPEMKKVEPLTMFISGIDIGPEFEETPQTRQAFWFFAG